MLRRSLKNEDRPESSHNISDELIKRAANGFAETGN
jgi:hypothetical protein